MADHEFVNIVTRTGLARALANPERIRLDKLLHQAMTDAGGIRTEVLGLTLLLKCDLEINGAAANGTNVVRPSRMPQAAQIVRIDAYAMTPPSGGEFTAVLTANGATVGSVSVAAGQTTGGTAILGDGGAVDAGAWLGLNVTADNGAADIAVTVTYRVV